MKNSTSNPTVHFTADTHFGHEGMMDGRMTWPRPFGSIEEHDETLIANWNAVVRPGDEIWHLGDFAYGCTVDHAKDVSGASTGPSGSCAGTMKSGASSCPGRPSTKASSM